MSAQEASASFGVPQSTIGEKIDGRSEDKVLNRGNRLFRQKLKTGKKCSNDGQILQKLVFFWFQFLHDNMHEQDFVAESSKSP